MPQMHFSVDGDLAAELVRRARQHGVSLSRYLADLVREASPGAWPEGFLEAVVGSCAKAPIAEPDELPLDNPAEL
jgi:hypothetical protein